MASFVAQSEGIISLCPPSAARAVATSVADLGFKGLYCDANAVNPETASQVSEVIAQGGGTYIDGSVISFSGLRLYLSGQRAGDFRRAYFDCAAGSAHGPPAASELEVIDMGTDSAVAASALKVGYRLPSLYGNPSNKLGE